MGAAATRGWPLPADTDLVRNLPAQLTSLADTIAGDAAGETAPQVAVGSGITLAANWTLSAIQAWHEGRLKMIDISVVRATSVLGPATSTGNLTDTLVFTLTGIWAPDSYASSFVAFPWTSNGGAAGKGLINKANGQVLITDAYPTSSIAIGDSVRMSMAYRGAS